MSETVYNNFVVIAWHEETGSTWIRYQKPVIMIFVLLVKTMVLHAQLVSWPARHKCWISRLLRRWFQGKRVGPFLTILYLALLLKSSPVKFITCSTSYNCLNSLGNVENSTGKRIALQVWKVILLVWLKIWENTP